MPPKRKQANAQLPEDLVLKLEKGKGDNGNSTEDVSRFNKKYKNAAKSRKEARKQARQEKKQRKNVAYKRAHGYSLPKPSGSVGKPDPHNSLSASRRSEPIQKLHGSKDTASSKEKKDGDEKSERSRLAKFAKRNKGMYELLRKSNLVDNVDAEAGIVSSSGGNDDIEDMEMRRLERILGIKKSDKLENAFYNEGLGDLLDGVTVGSSKIRQDPSSKPTSLPSDGKPKVSINIDPSGSDSDDGADSSISDDFNDDYNSDSGDKSEDDAFGLNNFGNGSQDDHSDSEDSDIVALYGREEDLVSDIELNNESDDELSSENDCSDSDESDSDNQTAHTSILQPSKGSTGKETAAESDTKTNVRKYIPPSLRQKVSSEDEKLAGIKKSLQGQLNRLSESNIDAIISHIEGLYRSNPRHDVTKVFTELILQSIRSRINMLDTFLYVNAALVGAVHRVIGLDPVAYFVQTLMEEFERQFKLGLDSFKSKNDNDNLEDPDELTSGKECQNLTVFLAELYNFQVISCQLVYDVIRLCIEDVNEFTAELLLKVIRVAGQQLRKDDPLALKEIVSQVTSKLTKNPSETLSVRCKFMVETLTNLKDNRMRQSMSQSTENIARLKKFLGNMDKRRSVTSTEPINISLQDIRDIDTKGKWWLVGSTWAGADENESEIARQAIERTAESTEDTEMDRLLKLAKQQHMNTDIRRSIFVTLLSSDDYADAFERLLKLDLKKTQAREVVRVILHCCGQEQVYNPYYALVSYKLCSFHNTYRLTLQYCLWDFLRETGETDVGGLGRITSETQDSGRSIPLRRIVNLAKLYAWLIDRQVLSLLILKTVTFPKVGEQARIFFQVLFSSIFLFHKEQTERDVTVLEDTFQKATQNPTMCHGILFFFHHFVRDYSLVKDTEKPIMKWGCKIAKRVFRSHTTSDMFDY